MSPRLSTWSLAFLVSTVGCQQGSDGGTKKASATEKKAEGVEEPSAPSPKPTAPPKAEPPAEEADKVPPGPPTREASREEIEATIEKLTAEVKVGASDPTNPWAMAHGLLAFGPELKAEDGRLAIDVIVTDYARVETVAGRKVIGFPTHVPSDTIADPQDPLKRLQVPVEPHPDLLVKSLVETGVPLKRTFTLKGGRKVTLKELVDDAAWTFTMPKTEAEWHKFAWSAALFLEAYGEDGKVKSHAGTFEVRQLVAHAVQRLESDQAFLLGPFSRGRPDKVQKRKQGIYGHTCGGLHFIQAAVQGAGRTKDPGELLRARKQLELVDFRWDAERRIYREMIRTQPKYRFLLLVQEMKFHGHVLETMAMAHEWGVLHATPATRAQARKVAADLVDAVRELEPMYASQAKLKKSVPQSYLDLIGDGCHAIRGLRQTLVAFFAPQTNP